ncbi:MAG: DUF433 domain-containing protein [Gammaproteobacteria bacterium]|nr:DUF433 domain-containing protein [Gammaproteobacteria bacterium]
MEDACLREHGFLYRRLSENLVAGATVDEFAKWFPGVESQQVRAVIEHQAQELRNALVH